MKIQFLKRKKVFKKGGFHVNPDTCWEIIVFSALFIAVIFLCFGLYGFFQIDKEFSMLQTEIAKQNNMVTREKIERALDYFEERERKSIEIINSPSPIIDPSL